MFANYTWPNPPPSLHSPLHPSLKRKTLAVMFKSFSFSSPSIISLMWGGGGAGRGMCPPSPLPCLHGAECAK